MKIRKVEIQAFRAYDEVADCTFDFNLNDGTCADFVSLYAPNGFGKTSFYDAVEWGVTNNIYRFTRQDINKYYAHDEKQLKFELASQKSPHYILRNKNSPAGRPSFVKLHLDGQDQLQERHLEEVRRVDSSDYHFDEKKTVNSYFRDVILSQDNIDAFLKEDDPHIRYKKFMDFFGDKELDRYYTNILCLIRANDQKITLFEDQIKKLQNELPLELDMHVLEKLNAKVTELTEKGESLPFVLPTFTNDEFIDFANHISNRKNALGQTEQRDKDQLERVQLHEGKITDFLILLSQLAQEQSRLTELQLYRKRFEELTVARNEMANKVLAINKASSDLKKTEELFEKFPHYANASEKIQEQTAEIARQRTLMLTQDEKAAAVAKELNEQKARLNQANSRLFLLNQRQTDLSSLDAAAEKSNIEIARLTRLINELAGKTLLLETELAELTSRQSRTEAEIIQISRNVFSEDVKKDVDLQGQLKIINDSQSLLTEVNAQLKTVESEITSNNTLNDELKQLIVAGSAYIQKTQTDTCPVCTHVYDSPETLSQRLLNHPLLGTVIQAKLAQKEELTQRISVLVTAITAARTAILNKKNTLLNQIRTDISERNLQRSTFTLEAQGLRRLLQQAEEQLKEVFVKTEGASLVDYSRSVQEQLIALQTNIVQLNERIAALITQDETERAFNESWKKTLQALESGIKVYRSSEQFLLLDEFIRRNQLPENTGLTYFTAMVDAQRKILDSLLADENEIRERLRLLGEALSQQNELTINDDIKVVQDQISVNKANSENFAQFIREQLSFVGNTTDQTKLEVAFAEKKSGLSASLVRTEVLLELLEQLEDHKNNVLPFLKFKATETAIDSLREQIGIQKERVGVALQAEKDKLSLFIHDQVESFFYEELINQLYKKIDPHPEYKKIKFKCDFNGEKPKLNVFVTGNEEIHLIPNLYFSTAQMNVLSLSIFLAKALNTRDTQGKAIDCIFIDDPIQSMDSINILSTIDLLRSIVVNLGKQVILSTHDENFFYLLQKKIPPNLFKAKFLELETFGKVKSNN